MSIFGWLHDVNIAQVGKDYIHSIDTSTHTPAIANVFGTLPFSTNVTFDGWTQSGGVFVCPNIGVYLISYVFFVHRTGGTPVFEARCFNVTTNSEFLGSQSSATVSNNSVDGVLTNNFIIDIASLPTNIEFQGTADAITANISPGGSNATTPIGASVSIIRIK